MKILMVTMSMGIGGAETHILELAKGLRARGIDVHVASAGGVFVEALEKAGVRHVSLPLHRREVFAMMRAERGLRHLIARERYDIVHAHARIPAFLCGRIRRSMNFRFVTTDHLDFELTPLLKRLTDWGEWTFAVSEDLKKYLLKHFCLNPDHISLTVNGVDTVVFSPALNGATLRETFEPKDRAVILHISRLDEPVTVCASALMDAMTLLEGRAQLVIVGDGDHANLLREKGKAINEKMGFPAVTFAGAQTDVKPYIAASDIVVSPSRAAMEGMACGKPTIISGSQGHGGIFSGKIEAEAIKSNLCFRGSPLPTADVLARELLEILNMNEDERRALGASCRAFIQRHYSVDRMVESQLAVYEKLTDYRTGGDPDVLLCGYYGYGNLGDETLLSVIIRELRRRKPSVRICVLSANPRKTAAYHMVDVVNRFDFSGIERKMKKTKLFMFGGGSLLQDRTSNRSLSYYIHMLRLAKKNGAKIAIFANGIGPILREKNKKRVHDVLSLSDMLSLRDSRSWEFCKSCCSDKNPRLTFDPAILVEKIHGGGDELSLIHILKNAVLQIKKNRGLRPVFISLFAAEDRGYAENLAHDCDAECISFSDAEACISYLSHARFLVSSRLHGLVYATAACLPMLAFTDDTKLLSYMETIGLGERGEFSLVYHVKSDERLLSERLDELLGGEGAIRAHLRNNLSAWREMAQREFDEMIRLLN